MTLPDLYTPRINHIQNFIAEHVRDDLKLDTLAQVAGFSPFHFHRIFKNHVGETVNDFVVRSRLERATALMRAQAIAHRYSICLRLQFVIGLFARV